MSREIKYIGMDVYQEAISIAVLNGAGKLVMESVIETKAVTILQFLQGLRGELHVTLEEGTWAAWTYDNGEFRSSVHMCSFPVRPSSACSVLSPSLLTCLHQFVQVRRWPNLENAAVLQGRMLRHELYSVIHVPHLKDGAPNL
jgi:hypothetical protein